MKAVIAVLLSILLLACSRQTDTASPLPSTQQTGQSAQAATTTDEPATCKHPVSTKGISVVCVIDGDTMKLADGASVRLIGMDAPEKGEYGYANATVLLQSLLDKSYVHMEKDVSDTDRFGRLLRYVYATDRLVNQYIVEEGWARAADYPPDIAKTRVLHQAEQQARDEKSGIWA